MARAPPSIFLNAHTRTALSASTRHPSHSQALAMAPKKADKKPAAKTTKPAAEKKKTKKKAKARLLAGAPPAPRAPLRCFTRPGRAARRGVAAGA